MISIAYRLWEVGLDNTRSNTIHPNILCSQLQSDCPGKAKQSRFADRVGTEQLQVKLLSDCSNEHYIE